MYTRRGKEEVATALLLSFIAGVSAFFYLPMIDNWFFSDDLAWVWASSNAQWGEMFFVPEVARGMSIFFTPMLGVSFKIDWLLFGMNPTGYSAHSLLSLFAAALALYLFIRLYTTRNTSLVGVVLFLLNPSTIAITSWFSARHYLEGLFFSLLGLYSFVRAERKGKVSILSGILYLLAALNKEVYVVLPAIAFLLAGGGISRRIKQTIPLFVGLLIYILWRFWIMKGMGGYVSMQYTNLAPALLYGMLKSFSSHWFGDYYALGYVFLLAAFLLCLQEARMVLIFSVLLVPIIPLGAKLIGDHYSGRYFFHLSVFMICSICLLIHHRTFGKKLLYKCAAFLVCLLFVVLFVKRDLQLSRTVKWERSNAKEAAMTLLYSERPYVKSDQFLTGFYKPLQEIYHERFGINIKSRLVPPEASLKYCDPERLREIRAAGIDIPYDEILQAQKKFRTRPLSIKLRIDNYKVVWNLAPGNRSYAILSGPVAGLYYGKAPMSPAGSMMTGRHPGGSIDTTYMRILYQADDKEEVISPEFVIELPGTQTIEYHTE